MVYRRYLGVKVCRPLSSLLSGLGPAERTLSGDLWSHVYEPLQQNNVMCLVNSRVIKDSNLWYSHTAKCPIKCLSFLIATINSSLNSTSGTEKPMFWFISHYSLVFEPVQAHINLNAIKRKCIGKRWKCYESFGRENSRFQFFWTQKLWQDGCMWFFFLAVKILSRQKVSYCGTEIDFQNTVTTLLYLLFYARHIYIY